MIVIKLKMLFNVSGKEVCDEMEKDCEEAII